MTSATDQELESYRAQLMDAIEQVASSHPDVTRAVVGWYGSGDEGGVQDITWFAGDEEDEVDAGLEESVIDLVDAFLQTVYGSWYDNEGGTGDAVVDVAARTVTLKHNWYVEESSPDDTIVLSETITREPPSPDKQQSYKDLLERNRRNVTRAWRYRSLTR